MTGLRQACVLLYPRAVRMDGGRGGRPETTAQDVAGAIGMIGNRLAREVFCAMNWPAGAALTRDGLLELIAKRQRSELERQWRAVQIARLDLHILLDNAAARNDGGRSHRVERARLERGLSDAKSACWPYNPAMYHRLRELALEELTTPNRCRRCEGRGTVLHDAKVETCSTCRGAGKIAPSDRGRAAALGLSLKSYQSGWRRLYDWTLDLLRDAELAGHIEGSAKLG